MDLCLKFIYFEVDYMDKVISKIAGLGVAGLVLLVAVGLTGLSGAAALTAALAALGPGGIVGGVVLLVAIGIVVNAVADYGFDAIFTVVVRELYLKGETRESILKKLEKYPLSKSLKLKIKDELDKYEERARKNNNNQ